MRTLKNWKPIVSSSFVVLLLLSRLGTGTAPKPQEPASSKTIGEADCSPAKLGASIPAASIGEPVSSVTLREPRWTAATANTPAYCSIDGAMAPIDTAS